MTASAKISAIFSITVWLAISLLALVSQSTAAAAPQFQAPTEEPTKAPYVFPTPIFIPTYPGDKAAPPPAPIAGATRAAAGQPAVQGTYIVQAGDSYWTIAQKAYGNGARYPAILAANGLTESTKLKVGTVLKIPPTDAAGQPILVAATAVPPTAVPPATEPASFVQPTAQPTPTPTPAPAGLFPSTPVGVAGWVFNIVSAFLCTAGIIVATLALLVYLRARRIAARAMMGRRLRLQ